MAAGQPEGTPDPVERVFLDYDLVLTFDRLAAELFLDRAKTSTASSASRSAEGSSSISFTT